MQIAENGVIELLWRGKCSDGSQLPCAKITCIVVVRVIIWTACQPYIKEGSVRAALQIAINCSMLFHHWWYLLAAVWVCFVLTYSRASMYTCAAWVVG